MYLFDNLGRALRWLRDRRGKKQYEVAEAAGITKGMLCAYETGKQRPSLETLDKILQALGSDLVALHEALALVSGRYAPASAAYPLPSPAPSAVSDLPRDTVGDVLRGFHTLVLQLHEVLQQLPPLPAAPQAQSPPPSRR